MDFSLPGSCVHGIFQARALEWGAIAFSAVQETWVQFLNWEDPLKKDMATQIPFDYSILVNGEGNGTPLQYFCLENPMDGGAW